jgi:hypothetical protein
MKKIILTKYFEAIGKRYNLDLPKLAEKINKNQKTALFKDDHFFIFLDNLYFLKKFIEYCNDSFKKDGNYKLNIEFNISSSEEYKQQIKNEFNLFFENEKYTIINLKDNFINIIVDYIKSNNSLKQILELNMNDEDELEEINDNLYDLSSEIFPVMTFNIKNHNELMSDIDFTISDNYLNLFNTVKHEISHFFSDPNAYKKFMNPEIKLGDFANPLAFSPQEILKELHALQSDFNYKKINKQYPFSTTSKYPIIINIMNSLRESLQKEPTWKDFRESLKKYKSILKLFPEKKFPNDDTIISLGIKRIKELEEMVIKASNISYNFFGNDISKIPDFEGKMDYAYARLIQLITSYKNKNKEFNKKLISFIFTQKKESN